MTEEQTPERRRFSRIPFEAFAHLKSPQGDLYLNCEVIDISLKGVLVKRPTDWEGKLVDPYQIDLLLEGGNIVIKMQTLVAHIDDNYLGFDCENIDLDSITHLKRLVELNLGDEGLLHRELHALIE